MNIPDDVHKHFAEEVAEKVGWEPRQDWEQNLRTLPLGTLNWIILYGVDYTGYIPDFMQVVHNEVERRNKENEETDDHE